MTGVVDFPLQFVLNFNLPGACILEEYRIHLVGDPPCELQDGRIFRVRFLLKDSQFTQMFDGGDKGQFKVSFIMFKSQVGDATMEALALD